MGILMNIAHLVWNLWKPETSVVLKSKHNRTLIL